MNYKEVENKLKEIKIEDSIWIIYIGIILLSWYSNRLEKNYFLNNDLKSKEEYRKLIVLIFSILICVYLYFLKDSFNSLNNIKSFDSNKKKTLTSLSFMGSLLIAISGFIFLYIAIVDDNIDVELAFNWQIGLNMV